MLIYILFIATSVVKLGSADDQPCDTLRYGSGTCVNITDCPALETELKNIHSKDRSNSVYCGIGIGMVCCPRQVSRSRWVSHRNAHLLTRNICGVPQDPPHDQQIARVNEFPWMALLVYDSETRPYQCGGSIITERYVLTVATCVTHELRSVRVGEHTISSAKDCQTFMDVEFCAPDYQEFTIEKTIRHESYESRDLAHNIALIRLSGSINLTRGKMRTGYLIRRPDNCIRFESTTIKRANVMPVCLPLDQSLQAMTQNGKSMTLTGWPYVDNFRRTDALLKLPVTVVGNEECSSRYRAGNLKPYLDDYKMCAMASGRGNSCSGNSGGPLTYVGKYGNRTRYIQYGVASHGANSCDSGLPEVYVKVASYIDWILNSIQT